MFALYHTSNNLRSRTSPRTCQQPSSHSRLDTNDQEGILSEFSLVNQFSYCLTEALGATPGTSPKAHQHAADWSSLKSAGSSRENLFSLAIACCSASGKAFGNLVTLWAPVPTPPLHPTFHPLPHHPTFLGSVGSLSLKKCLPCVPLPCSGRECFNWGATQPKAGMALPSSRLGWPGKRSLK